MSYENLPKKLWARDISGFSSHSEADAALCSILAFYLDGKISDERFMIMSSSYDKEQSELTEKVQTLEKFISEATKDSLNAQSFLNLVKKYTDITELDAEIIRTFVYKIYVEQSQKVEGARTKKQTIWIQWNYIGVVDINQNTEKSA